MAELSKEAQADLQQTWDMNKRAVFNDPKVWQEIIDMCTANPFPFVIPDEVRDRDVVTRYETAGGSEYFTLGKKDGSELPEYNIVFAHGGGFLFQMEGVYWDLFDRYLETMDCVITLLAYPLMPQHDYVDGLDYCMDVYEDVLKQGFGKKTVFMGDSAGGYLALAMAQLALERGLPQPDTIMLYSPCLDMSENQVEKMRPLQDKDAYLGIYGVTQLGKTWCASVPEDQLAAWPPSPLYGPLEGLAPIHCICGSEEILKFDTLALQEKAAELGIDIDVYVGEGLWHDYILGQHVPEARDAFDLSVKMIQGE